MSTYLVLGHLTEQGVRDARNIIRRIYEARGLVESVSGVKVRELFLVTGPYDYAAIVEAPDEAGISKALLSLGVRGNVRTQSYRAVGRDEVGGIIDGLV